MYNKGRLLLAGEYWESGAFQWTVIIENQGFLTHCGRTPVRAGTPSAS